ncbi:FtsX-like permease family protein [Streptomyces sp. NRRL F-5123]|uniref:FtsX-like permease family protein n=1 Tax=Streptomyces sp. NRRL F-5123 TaxID=1463856 RepID=UPI0004E17072|nr:FtsX family ABC transporter permease [Streptomyces sp. NRRL F-5123]
MLTRLALRTLKARRGGFLGAFLALFCAAALITACGGLLETGLSGSIATERYGAAPVVVTADQNVHQTTVKHKKGKTKVKHKAKALAERVWLPAGLAPRIAAVPGVRAVVPELTFPAETFPAAGADTGPGAASSGAAGSGAGGSGTDTGGKGSGGGSGATSYGRAYGHGWNSAVLTPFALVAGHAPTAADEVVVDRGLARRAHLAPGDRLTVQSTAAPRTYRVSGVAAPTAPGGAAHADLAEQTSLFFSQAEAERLAAHPGQVAAFGVLPQAEGGPDPDALRTALDGTKARVHTGDGRGAAEFPEAARARVQLVSMGGAIGGTALLVAILVVVGTFALSLRQRHRELALLRAVAATSRQLRQLIGREALLVGATAGVLGALAGLPLAHWLLGRFVALGAIPDTLRPSVGFVPMAAGALATTAGAWAAARISARRITRLSPAQALAESLLERGASAGRTVAGLLLLGGGAALVVVLRSLHTEPAATPVTFLTVIVLAIAVSLLGPLLVRGGAALLAGPLRAARFPGVLARRNLRGNAFRNAAAVTPLALLVAMASTVLFTQATLQHAAHDQAAAGTRGSWALTSDGLGVPGAAADAVRRTPGVTSVTEVVRTTVRVGLDKFPAQGVTAGSLGRDLGPDLDVVDGSLTGFGDTSVAVSETAARTRHVHPGSTLRVTLGDGTPVTLTVAAVYARGLGFGDLTMSHALVARHVDDPLAAAVLVRTAAGTDRAGLAAAVRGYPGIRVLAPGHAADALAPTVRRGNAEAQFLAMGLVLVFTAIAAVNTLAMSTAERVREFARLLLAGATRRQVLRMLACEATAVVTLAGLLGTAISLAVLTAFSTGMTGTSSPTLALLPYLSVLALAVLLALPATALPGRFALRPRPVDVMAAAD